MTEMQNTEATDEIVDLKIEAADEDGKPAIVEVIASIGEYDGIVVGLKLGRTYECAELTVAKAREMIAALAAAIDHLEPPHTATVNLRMTGREPYLVVGDLTIRDTAGALVLKHPMSDTDTPESVLAEHGWAMEGDWESSSATVRKPKP